MRCNRNSAYISISFCNRKQSQQNSFYKMKKTFFVVAAVILSSQLIAQQDSARKVVTLDEAVVTANKFEQKQSQTGKVITVITKEQLEKSGGKTVGQVLNEQAGVTIAGAFNPMGSIQTVFTRGASTGRTLILIDGVPVNDPSMIYNEFDLNMFSVNDVESIEVCKGAQSTLYGSDAIAGVINIITIKKDVSKPFNINATTSFGNRNTTRNNVQLYGKYKKLTYTTRFARLRTDGFSAAYDNSGKDGFENDGYDGNNISAAVQYQVIPELSIRTFIRHTQYKADIDGGVFVDDKDYRIRNTNLGTGAGLDFKAGKVNITANYQYGELQRKYMNDSAYVSGFTKFERNTYNARTQFVEIYGSIHATNWLTVLAGFDDRYATMNQQYFSISGFGPYSSSFPDTTLHQHSVYGSLVFNTPDQRLHLEVGGRVNFHSIYGQNETYTINPSFKITKSLRIFGSLATGFKAPGIFQLLDVFSGDPTLSPEKSVNYEGGLQFANEKVSTRAVFFHRNIKNGIDYNYLTFTYFNFQRQRANGLEYELTTKLGKFDLRANYTFIAGREQTQSRKTVNDTAYKYMLRRPDHSANLSLGYQFTPGLYVSVSGKYVGERHDVGGYQADDVLMNDFVLLNAYAEYKCKNQHIRFFADIQNIMDNDFFDIRGYTALPRTFSGGVTFNW
jgi:vitamin B12 transporter